MSRLFRIRIPLPIVSLMLIGVGVAVGDVLLVASHQQGLIAQYWWAIALMAGGPLAGITVFVYHLRTARSD